MQWRVQRSQLSRYWKWLQLWAGWKVREAFQPVWTAVMQHCTQGGLFIVKHSFSAVLHACQDHRWAASCLVRACFWLRHNLLQVERAGTRSAQKSWDTICNFWPAGGLLSARPENVILPGLLWCWITKANVIVVVCGTFRDTHRLVVGARNPVLVEP